MTAWWHLRRRVVGNLSEYQAEVYTAAGLKEPKTLYTTGWHPDPHSAVNDAEGWMEANGIVHGAAVGE